MAKELHKLGKYEIVGKLGKGAMGEVYKGHDPVLNRSVAIKVIAETLELDPELVERFRREAKMAAQLNHPNIITIYDFVEEDGSLYIIMELLDGKDLKDLIKSNSPFGIEQLLGFMEQISDGLGFAHENGMVHRDLKPANIHVTKKGQIKILDFGLVHDASSDMTKTGHVMGTPNYMSPEQVQGLKIDPRSDIFSLGAVFYELLTRKKPFSADSIHATMFKVVQGEREPLSQYNHLPPQLVQMVDRALDPNPDGRFDDANALRAYLREIRGGVLAGAPVADSTMTSMEGFTATIASEPGSHPSAPPGSHPSAPSGSYGNPSQRGMTSASGGGGTMRRRDMSAPSMGGSIGVPQPDRPIGLYVGGAVVVALIGAGLFYFSGRSGESGDGPSVQQLSQALVASQQELMARSLESNDYDSALTQADELLAADPQNTEALRVQSEARQALNAIDEAVAEAREALQSGATAEAADALSRVLALDPDHPLGTELHDQLNQHFQGQAQQAQVEMDRTRTQAQSAGASGQSEFRAAEQQRDAANADFNAGDYTDAAQKYLSARDQYTRARSAQQQAASTERQSSERQAAQVQAQQQQQQQESRRALDNAQSAWTRARSQPTDNGMTQLPSYERALAEEAAAKRLESAGDLEGAARGYQTATSYLETAQTEHREAQARRATQQQRAAVSPAPTPAPAPPPPAAPQAPTREQEEAAIRQTLANYERAIETEDIALFRQVKPNTSPDDAKRLQDSFDTVDDHQVELDIRNVTIQIDSATVSVQRTDTITVRGRSQNGNSRQSTFSLAKQGATWVIVQIQ